MPARVAHHLPVVVRVARSNDDLRQVRAVRAAVAGAADSGADRAEADAHFDLQSHATLLLAQSHRDGESLGSLRILVSDRGPLTAAARVELPAGLQSASIAEASRLAVRPGRQATLVRLMLWKAFHRFCLAAQIDTMLIAVHESAARQYEWLGFSDALPTGTRLAAVAGSTAQRLLKLGVFEAHERSLRIGHPLHDFFFVERHPEIDLLASVGKRRPNARPGRPVQLPDHAGIAAQLQELAIV